MKKTILLVLIITFLGYDLNAQSVNIPDINFKNYLLNNASINTNGDAEIQVSEASVFNGSINASALGISDLTGIASFVNLRNLTIVNNQLTSLDVSNNLSLESLNCNGNQLTSLNVSNNLRLSNLLCGNNQLASLDVSNNINLGHFTCSNNQLTSLDVSNNQSLHTLACHSNQLTSLDLTNNLLLEGLSCENNQLTNLDVSNNTILRVLTSNNNQLTSLNILNCAKLRFLYCANNQLTSIDLSTNVDLHTINALDNQLTSLDVSNNMSLARLFCNQNQLTDLDVSANGSLDILWCENNQLTSLNIANGNNNNIPTSFFKTIGNPSLTCITVDDPVYSTANWTNIDSQSSFGTNCNVCNVNIPDANFKSYLVNNSAINTNGDTEIQCSEATAFTGIINCSNKNISDLTGIEAFTALTRLDCSRNQLTNLNIAANTSLRYLNCRANQLTTIDASNNVGIRILNVGQNQLTTLDVTNNPILRNLYCNENLLTSLDVSTNANLVYLNCKLNQLTALDVSNNSALDIFYCGNNQITDLDISNNPNIRYFNSKNSALQSLNAASGQNGSMVSFDIRNNSNLTCVQVDNPVYSTNSWTNKDAQTNYNTSCPAVPVAPQMRSNTGQDIDLITTVNDISIYPNPAKGMVYVKTAETAISKIEILDVSGRVIRKEIAVKKGIDVSSLKSGVYYIKIYSEDGFTTKRLLKE